MSRSKLASKKVWGSLGVGKKGGKEGRERQVSSITSNLALLPAKAGVTGHPASQFIDMSCSLRVTHLPSNSNKLKIAAATQTPIYLHTAYGWR